MTVPPKKNTRRRREPVAGSNPEGLELTDFQYRYLIENALDIMMIVGIEGIFQYVSPAVIRSFGYQPEELIGQDAFSFIHRPDRQGVLQALTRIASDPQSSPASNLQAFRFKHKDGTWRFLEAIYSRLPGESDTVEIVVNARDITDQMVAREALRHSTLDAQRVAKENEVIAEIGRIISSSLSVEEVFEGFWEQVQKFIPADQLVITNINADGGEVSIWHSSGLRIDERGHSGPVPLKGTLTAKLVASKATLLVQATEESQLAGEYPWLIPAFRAGIRSWLAVPLMRRDELIGALIAITKETDAYPGHIQEVFRRIGDQIAGAIGNSQIYAELQRAEEAQRESEERYRGLIGNLSEGVFRARPGGEILSANTALAHMYGYDSPEEFMATVTDPGTQIWVDQYRRIELVKELRGRGKVAEFEAEMRRKNGSIIWASHNVAAVFEESGKLDYFEGTSKDITARKRAEDALRDSERKYRALFDNANDAILLFRVLEGDEPSQFIEVNEAACQRLGYTRQELLGMSPWDINSPEVAPEIQEIMQIIGKLGSHTFEWVHVAKDGGAIPVEISSHSFVLNGEQVVLAFARDITDRKRAEDALRDSEERYRNLIGNLSEGVFQITPEGKYISANFALANMLGFESPERLMTELTNPREQLYVDEDAARSYVEILRRDGRVSGFEIMLYRRDGNTIWVSANSRSIYDAAGSLIQYEGTVVDITERKRLEGEVSLYTQSLEKAYRDLQELDNLKDNFLSSVSHELRTPLTSIKGSAEILLSYDDVEQDVQTEFLTIINNESERLTRLINDVLDLSRIEAGLEQWADSDRSMNNIVETAVAGIQVLAMQKDLSLEVELDAELPEVWCDKDKLIQVVTNLLSNAIKFTPEFGTVTVSSRAIETDLGGTAGAAPAKLVQISVADTGIGIAPEDVDAVFQKFRQVGDTLSDRPKGTGLGLPICREIIENYGGRIWVDSQLGEGSTFNFTIPTGRKEHQATTNVGDDGFGAADPPNTKMILVVDDETNVRRLLSHELIRQGYLVLEASNGKQATDLAREYLPDLITMDVLMPQGDGYDAITELKNDAATQDIPILIISIVEDKQRGIELGANEFITKPFKIEEILDKVGDLLRGGGKKVLIADDDRSLTQMISFELQKRGFVPTVAHNGREAISVIDEQKPDLVVLDIVMPGSDGYEVLTHIRRIPDTTGIPVIILTGVEIDGGRVKALSLGATEYITKSGGMDKLVQEVERILSVNA